MASKEMNEAMKQIAGDILQQLESLKLKVAEEDLSRPWGGYFRISDSDSQSFRVNFFGDFSFPEWAKSLRTDPKILLIKPSTRLSWQYHDRRGEVWKVLEGPIGVMTSSTDTQPSKPRIFQKGEIIEIPQGRRHRLIGLNGWGIVAEIWVSTDPNYPTNESDNHRLSDDYGRT